MRKNCLNMTKMDGNMSHIKLGRKKVVYSEGNQTRAIRGFVTIQDEFIIVTTDRYNEPIWINKKAVLTIKNPV